jgi:hypothetical protein
MGAFKELHIELCEMNDEETGKWAIVNFFPHAPMEVYGLFDTEQEAHDHAYAQGMASNGNAYEVKMVLNAHYYEDASDYAGMGWVGQDGRP